ncbi:MAG: enoyl-CoA hydratase/isomerase family protein [Candidatus Hodarchaeales archaeon]|jgi:enoyl-CoA hydratase
MDYKDIAITKPEDGIAVITLNRPTKYNAVSDGMLNEIRDVLQKLEHDTAVKVVIVTGAGEKAFASGADIEGFSGASVEEGRKHIVIFQKATDDITRFSKPIFAAVNGYALGGGCEIMLACDFAYASENAKFGLPEISLGIIPGGGGTQRLPRLVGKGLAMELIMTGNMIDAAQAKEIGLVNRVVPLPELMTVALETARSIAAKGSIAVREAKYAISKGLEGSMEAGIAIERDACSLLFSTEDFHEGVKAFLEKRKPEFKGK